MKLQDRLTLIATLLFGVVFTLASTIVYVGFVASAERIINENQKNVALLTAMFYLEEDELPSAEHQRIRQEFNEQIRKSEARIYNESDSIRYGLNTADSAITATRLEKVRNNKLHNFISDGYYYTGIFYTDNQGDFVVYIKDDHSLFNEQRRRMLIIIVSVLFAGIVLIAVLSRYLSRLAYRPVKKVIRLVTEMNSANVAGELPMPGTRDEIDELVQSYNRLLAEISDNMETQKNFIDFVSHEFRTPLTAINGHIEVFTRKERNAEENAELASKIRMYVQDLEEILHTMLVITRTHKPLLERGVIRVDEVLWDTVEDIGTHYSDAVIRFNMDVPSTESGRLSVRADRSQLRMALFNLLKNAIKYSDHAPVEVFLGLRNEVLVLEIADHGIGIEADEMSKVSKAFYRGSNVGERSGSGVGLTIALTILKQNNIDFTIESSPGQGTTIILTFSAHV